MAVRTQILFFCVSDLANVDPMYQYSLEWFLNIFLSGIANSERAGSAGMHAHGATNARLPPWHRCDKCGHISTWARPYKLMSMFNCTHSHIRHKNMHTPPNPPQSPSIGNSVGSKGMPIPALWLQGRLAGLG